MMILKGTGVSGGVAIGRVRLLRQATLNAARRTVDDPAAEWQRFVLAAGRAVTELYELYEWSIQRLGQESAEIFRVHAMMLQDEDFRDAVRQTIEQQTVNAEYALSAAADHFAATLGQMEDTYMQQRAGDVRDVSARVLRHLSGASVQETAAEDGTVQPRESSMGECVLCAEDLTPSETVQLDRAQVCAFVTAAGSSNSHTAILSRTMSIPAVVGVGEELDRLQNDTPIAVDADAGCVYVEPDEPTLQRLRTRMEQQRQQQTLLQRYRGRKSQTVDGHRVEVYANVGSVDDLPAVIHNDAEGIGLFRSEFLYLGRQTLPTEEEQLAAYSRVLQDMAGKRVVVRTLDIGADKRAPCLPLPDEDNPALGCRGVRISLMHPDIFKTQARALLRASPHGRLAVMFPMVISEDEVLRMRALWDEAARELSAQGIPFAKHIELGVMIETPAAALISATLARHVDFFSIGTNDLTQYTLALDRQNAALEQLGDAHHEAVSALIRMTVENAKRAGIWVGICGEMGADVALTEALVRMGVDEFSVAPPAVLAVRARICSMHMLPDHAERVQRAKEE